MDNSTIAISCDECRLQDSGACDDCLVTFVVGRDPDDAVVIDAEEVRALRQLTHVGLVPSLRFSSRGDGRAAG